MRLQELKSRWKMIGDVSGLGLALRIEICQEDGHTANRALTDHLFNEALKGDLMLHGKKYGMILDIGGYEKNVITPAPSLLITEEEIDLGIELLDMLLQRTGAR
jgi:4-aminobutyrate aminotransferase-like enzyme